jgi:uncharacterized membrane protein
MHIRNPLEWLVAQLDTTAVNVGTASPDEYWTSAQAGRVPAARKIDTDDLKIALVAGLRDFGAARTDVVFLCLIYPVIGLLLAGVTAREALLPLLFPVASGFALVGPLAALGLYEISRRREITGSASWVAAFDVLRSPSIKSIALLGFILIGLFLLWLAAAQGIYDITLGPQPPASTAAFVSALLTTGAGWAMIVIGLGVGAVFATVVLAISAVSFPMLLDRPVGLGVAIRTSVYALRRNPVPLALWGVIVAVSLFVGSLPCFLGLVVVLPVLGHSTWHLYRRLVRR